MKPDGTMARMPDLEGFAKEHGLVIVSIADLIEYRLQKDRLVERASTTQIELSGKNGKALFAAHVYKAVPGVRRKECVALTLGDLTNGEPVPCRGHLASLVDDVFGGKTRKSSPPLQEVIDAIIKRGRGVVLYLPSRESIEIELAMVGQPKANREPRTREGEIREYGIGAQILLDLGVERLQVISNNPHRLVGLEAWGFKSAEQISLKEV
jgi:3,4-dihydroxy 2-butanone 4-phosphate synthase/GTP cyclohydrolase II